MAENTDKNERGAPAAKRATTVRKPVPARAVVEPKAGKKKKNKKGKKAGGKVKVVRDFSMPQTEYAKLAELKQACLKAGMRVKKNDLLRAGLLALGKLSVPQLKQALVQIGQVKTVRSPEKTRTEKP